MVDYARKLIEAAFAPPGKAVDALDAARFAILPQQTQDQLVLSEVHTNLDRALSFLQREIGYSLLDDARPRPGGGVRLDRKPALQPSVERRAEREPKKEEEPAEEGGAEGEVLRGGVAIENRRPSAPLIVEAGDPESVREVIRFSGSTAKYAQYADDLVLVWRFASILGTISHDALQKVKTELLLKTVLQGVRLMHLCDYHYSDVVVTLAHASVYFRTIFHEIGHKMSPYEAAHVCVLLIYLAHSFILDETCPLRCWQRHIFRRYCTLKVLDAALFKLFIMREDCGGPLRVTEAELRDALKVLLCSPSEVDVILSLEDRPEGSNGYMSSAATTGPSSGQGAARRGHENGVANGVAAAKQLKVPFGDNWRVVFGDSVAKAMQHAARSEHITVVDSSGRDLGLKWNDVGKPELGYVPDAHSFPLVVRYLVHQAHRPSGSSNHRNGR